MDQPVEQNAPQYDGTDYSHFYFILYQSNPIRENVRLYIDGEESLVVMRHKAFLNLIVNTVGWQIEAAIKETLHTYGTFWLLDRENSLIRKVAPIGGEDIRNIREEMIKGRIEGDPEKQRQDIMDTINPAEPYAKGKLDLPFFSDPKDGDLSRTKRRGISLLFPRIR